MDSNLLHGVGFGIFAVIGLIVFLIFLVPFVFYVLTLQKALNRCAPENRAMEPTMIWLLLVPCFNIIWHFFVVLNMAKSLGKEFQKRGLAGDPEPGKKLGLVTCILPCCSIIPFVNMMTGPAYLVCWIMYWVKIADYSKKLA